MFLVGEDEDGEEEQGNASRMSLLLSQPTSPLWPYRSDLGFGYKDEFNFTGVSSPAPFSPLWNFSDDHRHNPIPDNHNNKYFSVLCNPIAVQELSLVFTDNQQLPTIDISIAVEVVSKYILHELDIIWNKKSDKRQSSNIVSNLGNILSRRVVTSSTKECSHNPYVQTDNEFNLCIRNNLPLSIEQQTVLELDEIEGEIGSVVQGITSVIRDKRNISSCKYTTSENAISLEDLQQRFSMTREDAAKSFDISVSTFKRVCRKHGISRWPFRKRKKKYESPSELKSMNIAEQESGTARSGQADFHPVNPEQEGQFVTVKAKYLDKMIRFDLPYLSEMIELEDQIAKRLKLEVGSFSIEYEDEDGDQILLTSCNDLRYCIDTWTCLGKTTVRTFVKLTTG